MKIRWRQHEIWTVTIIAAFAAIRYFLPLFTGAPFKENVAFYKNILQAQYTVLFIQYGCYLWLNKGVIARLPLPGNMPATGSKHSARRIILKYSITALQLIAIIYLLGPVSNMAEYFGTKDFPDSGIVNSISGVLPAHPQEPYNVFGGFDITAFFVGIYMAYALMREMVIYLLEKNEGHRQLRISVINRVTLIILIEITSIPLLMLFSSDHQSQQGPGQSTLVLWYAVVPVTLGVCMANIYWLFPLTGDTPLLRSRIVGRLLLVTCAGAVPAVFFQRAQLAGPWPFFFGAWAVQLFIVTPLSWLYYQQQKEKILQLRGMEEALTRSKADLQFLRSQINPHFLFNALNTLYGTALQEGSERTAGGIQMLGDMMRFMLHENNLDVIPIQREIDYLQNYIALQKLRIQQSPGINIETVVNAAGCTHNIAPMLLIPFVENAFKHGISLVQPSWIKINLQCGEKSIQFTVHNSMHPKQENDTEKDRSGIGVVNVVERLKLLYPGRHQVVFNGDGQVFFVQLHIQF